VNPRGKGRGAKHVRLTSSRTTGTSKRAAAGVERDARGAESETGNEEMDPTRGRFEGPAPPSRVSEGACGDVKDSMRVDDRPLVEAESDGSK
jgi:hypothetical protein